MSNVLNSQKVNIPGIPADKKVIILFSKISPQKSIVNIKYIT